MKMDLQSLWNNASLMDTNSTMPMPLPISGMLALGIVLPLVLLWIVSLVLLCIGALCCAVFQKKKKRLKNEMNSILDGSVSRSRTSLNVAHNGGKESTESRSIPSAEDDEYYMTMVDPGSVEEGRNDCTSQPTTVTETTSNNRQTTAGPKSATITSAISQDRYMGLQVDQMEKQYYTHLVEGEQGEPSEEYYMPMDLDIQPPAGNQKVKCDNKAKTSPPKTPCKPSPRQPSPLLPPSHQKSPNRTSPRQRSPLLPSSHQKSPHQMSPHQTSPHQTPPHQTSPHKTSPHKMSPHQKPPHKPPPRTRPALLPHQLSEDSVEYENTTKWTTNVKSPTSPMYANAEDLKETGKSTEQKGPTPMYTNIDIMNEVIEDVYYI